MDMSDLVGELNPEMYREETWRDIAEAIGVENFYKLTKAIGGETVYIPKRFFFSGGVFYWGEKPEQQKVYTFEYGVNIINLVRFGGVWELETVSAPFVRHSHKINIIHPKISGEQEVVKVVSSTNDDGFIRTRIYF